MNPSRLAQTSNKLLDNRLTGPLFDTPRLMDNLGTAYTAIHHQYQAGSPPGNIRF
jgi:predicted O-linked N-acetylglucosamine transferase (SPINDLY family)